VSHPQAVLTPVGRLILVERIAQGRPATHVASEMGISRATAYKWWRRYVQEGEPGLHDRSSRPLRSPRRTPARVERQIEVLRRRTKLGPVRLAIRLHMPASTVHRVLVRQQLSRLSWMDRPTGRVIRRYEREQPGELVHVDVKKLGRIPPGGGWRTHGRLGHPSTGVGFDYVHSAVDDHSRLAYSEICSDERGPTAAALLGASHGVLRGPRHRGPARAHRQRHDVPEIGRVPNRSARKRRGPTLHPTSPVSNQWQGRARQPDLLEEWAYVRPYSSNQRRTKALTAWLHIYNYHRAHTSLGQLPPISRLNNVSGYYI